MEADIKDFGKIIMQMEKENLFIVMEIFLKVSGIMGKYMVKEFFIHKIKSNIKVNGKTINIMDRVF